MRSIKPVRGGGSLRRVAAISMACRSQAGAELISCEHTRRPCTWTMRRSSIPKPCCAALRSTGSLCNTDRRNGICESRYRGQPHSWTGRWTKICGAGYRDGPGDQSDSDEGFLATAVNTERSSCSQNHSGLAMPMDSARRVGQNRKIILPKTSRPFRGCLFDWLQFLQNRMTNGTDFGSVEDPMYLQLRAI